MLGLKLKVLYSLSCLVFPTKKVKTVSRKNRPWTQKAHHPKLFGLYHENSQTETDQELQIEMRQRDTNPNLVLPDLRSKRERGVKGRRGESQEKKAKNKSPNGHCFTDSLIAQCEQVSPSPVLTLKTGLDGCGFVTR